MPRKKKIVEEVKVTKPTKALAIRKEPKVKVYEGDYEILPPIRKSAQFPVLIFLLAFWLVSIVCAISVTFSILNYNKTAPTQIPTTVPMVVPTITLVPTLVPTETLIPTATSTPTICIDGPCSTIINYYGYLQDTGDYGKAWNLLTSRWQNIYYQGDYQSLFYETLKKGRRTISEMRRETDDGDFAVIYLKLQYNDDMAPIPYRYWLLYDFTDKVWKIDRWEYIYTLK